jgi:hypothetical protein
VSVLPTFLVIGAAKAGTTAVYEYLRQHPQVFMSPVKEPHFFALEGAPIAFTGPGDAESINRVGINDPNRYRALFAEASGYRARGEGSVSYLYSPRAPRRIAEQLPDVRLIAVLRDPVERAYSTYLYQVARGLEPAGSFAEALADEPRRIAEGWHHIWHYRAMGEYGAQLARYLDVFEKDRMLICFYDDLVHDPYAFMRRVFGFVGVDEGFRPDTRVAPGASGVPRHPLLEAVLFRNRALKRSLRAALPERLLARVGSRLRRRTLTRPPLDPSLAASLRAGYRRDLETVETVTGRDLSVWYAPPEGGA